MLVHALTHTAMEGVQLFPFLFLSYVLVEIVEHKMDNHHLRWLKSSGRLGPLVGALLGLLPQCGFSAAAANLYAVGIVSRGTLIAVFLATSDEMLPILIANHVPITFILLILASKVLIGSVCGIVIDLACGRLHKSKQPIVAAHTNLHTCSNCSHGILFGAFIQALKITVFLWIILFLLDIFVEYAGLETLSGSILNHPVCGPIAAALLALVPSCAVSIALTTLYLQGGASLGTLLSGLLVGSGVGTLVLLRSNRNWKDNLAILCLLYGIGVLFGLLAEWIAL